MTDKNRGSGRSKADEKKTVSERIRERLASDSKIPAHQVGRLSRFKFIEAQEQDDSDDKQP